MRRAAGYRLLVNAGCCVLGTVLAPINTHGQAGGVLQGGLELIDPKVLRVCADPNNLPFSNDKSEGFENKIAELFAAKLGKTLAYTYYPGATGFVRMTLGSYRCDVVMGFPQGGELAQSTNPYYRTAYALVSKAASALAAVETLEDVRLKDKRLGVVAGTPPASYLVADGLITNSKPYPLGILRLTCHPPDEVNTAFERKRRPSSRLSYRHGCSSVGPELEKTTKPVNWGEPTSHQQAPA